MIPTRPVVVQERPCCASVALHSLSLRIAILIVRCLCAFAVDSSRLKTQLSFSLSSSSFRRHHHQRRKSSTNQAEGVPIMQTSPLPVPLPAISVASGHTRAEAGKSVHEMYIPEGWGWNVDGKLPSLGRLESINTSRSFGAPNFQGGAGSVGVWLGVISGSSGHSS